MQAIAISSVVVVMGFCESMKESGPFKVPPKSHSSEQEAESRKEMQERLLGNSAFSDRILLRKPAHSAALGTPRAHQFPLTLLKKTLNSQMGILKMQKMHSILESFSSCLKSCCMCPHAMSLLPPLSPFR